MQKAKNKGLTPMDMLKIKALAKSESEKMESRANEKAFLYMLAIPLNVLANDYWEKSAKKRMPMFIEEVFKLYESVQAGVVSDEELKELLTDYAGVDIEAEWLKSRKE